MGSNAAFDARIHALRPHPGQVACAANLRRLTAESGIIASHRDCTRVQDAYSIRCTPQVLGAVASSPLLASEAAAVLVGQRLTPEVIDTAAQAAFRPAKPLDNTDLTLAYRKKMARVHVTRVLRQLVGLPVVPHR